MAECVPIELPSQKPGIVGERKVFEWLRELPDDCIVYYEPITGRRYPDFVVILPMLGVLVIEVKGWSLEDLRSANAENFQFETRSGRLMTQANPLRQVRAYVHALMDECSAHLWGRCLRWDDGKWQGSFRFPFAHAVVLTQIKRADIDAIPNLAALLPAGRVLSSEELAQLKLASPAEKLAATRRFFDLFQTAEPLGPAQIAALRAIIHPEIQIAAPTHAKGGIERLKVLDLAQERAALCIGSGHRLVFGVAGSGKTVLLIARARLLAAQRPDIRILVLCFNVTLAVHLAGVLRELGERVVVAHFHKIVHDAGIDWKAKPLAADPDKLGLELLARTQADEALSRHFDALLIDEAQDFAPSWIQAALGLVKQPDEADVFITGDGNQGIFGTGKRRFTWASIGVRAAGRTEYLRRAYRSSREIITLAARFASGSAVGAEGVAAVAADAALAQRVSGFAPWLIRARSRRQETDRVLHIVQDLLEGKWRGRGLEQPLSPEEIAILYPRLDPDVKPEFERLRAELRRLEIGYNWLSADEGARRGLAVPGVRLQTMHSSKGLQYRAVVLLWTDLLPRAWGAERDPAADRLLLYVGLTRAEDFLAVLASGHSAFTDELRAAGRESG